MKIDTKFNRGDVVYYMSGNRICCSAIKEIEIHLSVDYKEEPAIIYKLFDGCHLVNPEILCATGEEVAAELLKRI